MNCFKCLGIRIDEQIGWGVFPDICNKHRAEIHLEKQIDWAISNLKNHEALMKIKTHRFPIVE